MVDSLDSTAGSVLAHITSDVMTWQNMEDMFYFRSPTGSISRTHRPELRQKLKSYKRRRNTNMEVQTQRACVVRLEEPVFCPSGLASIIPRLSSTALDTSIDFASDNVTASGSTPDEVQCQDVDDSISNSDDGATAKQPSTSNYSLDQEDASLPSSHAQRILHPRPESHDIAQEEDGRRIRFAMEDANEYAGLIQRLLHLTAIPDVGDLDGVSPVQQERSSGPEQMHSSSSATGLPMIYAYDMDDDALAVDDPRRSYDFKEFVERWSFDEDCRKHDLSSQQDLCSLIPDPLVEVTRNDMESCDADSQGLRWDRYGSRRETALQLRRAQHPSRRTFLSTPTSLGQTFTPEVQYRFRTFSPKHRAHYSHYQLRNVLAAVNRNDIFYSTGNKVMQTSLTCPSIESLAMDLSKTASFPSGVRITCLAASAAPQDSSYRSDRALLAGGSAGEYAMLGLNVDSQTHVHEGFVTHDYNGLVTHIDSYADRHSGQLRACFCSNDRKVQVMDVKTGAFVNSFSYANATNCSATSPDSRLRVMVGDSHETLITDAEKGNVLVTLQEHRDHGFSCAWSEDGRYVATGAQDGLVLLWDARNWSTPLRTMPCVMSTARSLQFTSNGALVAGEDDDVVTIHDTERPEMRQDIRFFGSIAGVALLDGGDELVIANADKTVGGLMSFQRAAQGLNGGTFGNRMYRNWSNNRMTTRGFDRTARATGRRSEIVSEIFV